MRNRVKAHFTWSEEEGRYCWTHPYSKRRFESYSDMLRDYMEAVTRMEHSDSLKTRVVAQELEVRTPVLLRKVEELTLDELRSECERLSARLAEDEEAGVPADAPARMYAASRLQAIYAVLNRGEEPQVADGE